MLASQDYKKYNMGVKPYNQKNTHFWYSYYRIGMVLCKHFAISEAELELLMKYNIEKTFKILNTIPSKHREIQ